MFVLNTQDGTTNIFFNAWYQERNLKTQFLVFNNTLTKIFSVFKVDLEK